MLLDKLTEAAVSLADGDYSRANELLLDISGEVGLTVADDALAAMAAGRFQEAQDLLEAECNGETRSIVIESQITGRTGSDWEVALIEAGLSANKNYYPSAVLKRDAHLFEGARVFDAHAEDEETARHAQRKAHELLGRIKDVRFEDDRLVGRFKVYASWLREMLVNAWEEGDRDILGFSIDAMVNHRPRTIEGQQVRYVTGIRNVNSVDVVLNPAAGGRLERLVASKQDLLLDEEVNMDLEQLLEQLEQDDELRESLIASLTEDDEPEEVEEEQERKKKKDKYGYGYGYPAPKEEDLTEEEQKVWDKAFEKAKEDGKSEDEARAAALAALNEFRKKKESRAEIDSLKDDIENLTGLVEELAGQVEETQQASELERYQRGLRQQLAESKLPDSAQEMLFELLSEDPHKSEEDINRAIEAQREILADSDPTGQVRGNGRVSGVQPVFGIDAAELTMASMLDVLSEYDVEEPGQVEPMSLREWYTSLTGDHAFEGVVAPRRVTEANVTTSTVTSIVKNVLNKRIVKDFEATQAMRWWEPIVTHVDNQTINDVTEIVTAGFGELSTVPEGAPYDELSWSDVEETASFVKRGDYIGITIETFMRDNLNRLRAIPRKLNQAFNYTVGKNISDSVFTANSGAGPTLNATGRNLFNTTDLSRNADDALSYAGFVAASNTMAQQTELGSNIQLGLRPAFLLVPPELYHTGLKIQNSDKDPDNAENGDNTVRDTFQTIEVPIWTDSNNWYLLASPNMAEVIVLHWYQGQRTPTLVQADTASTGAMFTHDEMRYKISWWMALAVADYRGAYGSIVP